MKRFLIILTALLAAVPSADVSAWGRKGHETIAKIAERNLTAHAKEVVERYLDGHSIVYYAKWLDEYRETPEYGFTSTWHGTPLDENNRYTDALLEPEGNAIYGIELALDNLRDYKSQSDSTVCVNIKYLLHLVGDMHCPVHLRYPGRDMWSSVWLRDVYNNPVRMSIHLVWDNGVIDMTRIWSVSEWAEELDRWSDERKAAVTKGTPRDWLNESADDCLVQFELSKPDDYLGQEFYNRALPLIESQITKAGYRLASLLNKLFN